MSIRVNQFRSRQRMDVPVTGPNGANRLLIYGGIAQLDEWFAIDNKLVLEEVDIILGSATIADPKTGDNFGGIPFTMVDAVATVSLAAVNDLGDSDNVGWGVRETQVQLINIDPVTRFLQIHTKIAFQGEAAGIQGLTYHADVLAIASPEDVQWSFDLSPSHISTSTLSLLNTSNGIVTLTRPAPAGGVHFNITSQSPTPGLVLHPQTLTINPGSTVGTFQITATLPSPATPTVVRIEVSRDGLALARNLTVGGS